MPRLFRLSCLVLAITMSGVVAAEKPASVKLCTENEESYPWLLKSKPGLSIIMMQMVEKKLGTKLDIQPLPWKRCMEEVKQGNMDGLFKISFKADRLEMGHYPMVGDKPDNSKRMLDDSYSFYRLKGNPVDWDGKTLKHADAGVGAQSGFSVVDQLKGMGLKVDDGTRVADDNLRKVLSGRLAAVALQTQEGDASIASQPEFNGKLERFGPPLVEKPYFLMLSKSFVAKQGELAKQIWDAVAAVRESPEYKKQLQSFK
ncbi:polar amino acid transport system substrate-binding protein [Chitinivorax tropicus]|uniref:Polar amino acid transport system substrate-binding protein n=1 Tax=Chitinivorax tropicus TaxID=714531 RepID=A0A840MV44_9PROT|nr:transporter substrate-binding domain-containing protein [Chitinivorax tropicus]MBB5020193.1 polar amino acid transport system substrate-binding protein [Chitinivorax tropicus]